MYSLNNIKYGIKEYFGEEFMVFFDYVLDLVPYGSNFNQTRKIHRAEQRIINHALHLKQIHQLFSKDLLSSDFIQDRVAPIVLSDLIEEHEGAKISYILNGFENIFINQNTNESLILNYYDTLRNLRYEDIRKLFFYAAITEDPFKDVEVDTPLEGLSQQIFKKLERLHLITTPKTWAVVGLGAEFLSENQRKVKLTSYGLNFIKFISTDFNEQRYNERVSKFKINEDEIVSDNKIAKWG